jgi:hypothetical protein
VKHAFAAWVRRVGARILPPPAATPQATPAMSVPEITLSGARCIDRPAPRLNFMLPSINAEHYFGGIHTAVELYRAVCAHCPESRIILTDSAPRPVSLERFADHELVDSQQDSSAPRQVVAFNDRYQRPLAVGAGDVFVATAWWTAYAAQSLVRAQAAAFGTPDRIGYLIQDFEPGFYPWSSRYALAMSTYRPEQDFAVFNTRLLADYTARSGIRYRRSAVFEPTINTGLRPFLDAAAATTSPRKRQILVYARPSTPRNAFELICEALSHWSVTYPGAAQWEILALGELEGVINIGATHMTGVGKLDLPSYGRLLAESSVGLSLMVSPHPSYPPLEMAAFGMDTLVNQFGGKDLGSLGEAFHSVPHPTPELLSRALAEACAAAEARGMAPHPVGRSVPAGFLSGPAAPFAAVASAMLAFMRGDAASTRD